MFFCHSMGKEIEILNKVRKNDFKIFGDSRALRMHPHLPGIWPLTTEETEKQKKNNQQHKHVTPTRGLPPLEA